MTSGAPASTVTVEVTGSDVVPLIVCVALTVWAPTGTPATLVDQVPSLATGADAVRPVPSETKTVAPG